MRKTAIRYALYAIPLALFNLLFFLIGGTAHAAPVWISYVWIQVAFLLLLISPRLSRTTENSPVYRISLALISLVYFAVEFVIGLIVIILHPAGVKGPVIAQVIPFALYLFVFLLDLLFVEYASDADKEKEEKEKREKAEKANKADGE